MQHIESWILVETITQQKDHKQITVAEKTKLNYLVVMYEDAAMDISIDVQAHAEADITILCIGQEGRRIQSNVVTSLVGNNAQANVYILALLKDKADFNVHGSIILSKNVAKVSWHLLEENIILGERVKIRTAPILDVHSSDVSASHGCKIEKLDPKRLFYMQSRGLTPLQSQSLILDGYLNTVFEGFEGQEDLRTIVQNLIF